MDMALFSFFHIFFFFCNFFFCNFWRSILFSALCCFLSCFLWFHASRVCWHCHSTWPLQFALYPGDARDARDVRDACVCVVATLICMCVCVPFLLRLFFFFIHIHCHCLAHFCCCFFFLLILYFLDFVPVASHLKWLSLTNYISCIMHKYALPLIWFGCFL